MERTLSIIKPDATKRNITGKINAMIENKGFRIIEQKKIKLTEELAKNFYLIHKDKPFYKELVDYMISGPIVVQVLESHDAVNKYRLLMGNTNPENAEKETIRNKYAINIQENSVHGSDSAENAQIEIDFFFHKNDIVG